MDKVRNKNIRRVIAFLSMTALVVLLAAMPLLAKQEAQEDGPKASILTGTVTAGSIDTRLLGGGMLTESDAVTVSIPSAVKLTEFLVSNGDYVTEGTPIAGVDRVTVMTAITQVQETLDYLSEQIEEARDTDTEESVTALAGGTVKLLYAREGDSVQNVMLEYGALAVLSLDGLMAVDLEADSELSAGSEVKVVLSDGTGVTGKVVRNLAGSMTVTVEDDDYAVGQEVEILTEDGSSIGSGGLYIYSPWNATAYTGTIDDVRVSEGDTLTAGKTLMVLTDVGYSAAYRQLIGQRQAYEELMLELFRMYQTETVDAPADGVVSGIDSDSLQLLSGEGQGFVLTLLANAPNGDNETVYYNYVTQVETVAQNGWVLKLNPEAVPIEDYLDLSGVNTDTSLMTQTVLHTKTDLPLFELQDGAWVLADSGAVGSGDILLFAADGEGNLIWSVLVQKAQQPEEPGGPTDPTVPSEPTEPADPSEPTVPSEPSEPSEPSDPTAPSEPTGPAEPGDPGASTDPSEPAGSETPGAPGGTTVPSDPGGAGTQPGFTYPSGGSGFSGMGSMSGMGGIAAQEPEFELYGMDFTQIAAVTPQDTMTLEITVDELDILSVLPGMTAQVRIDALGGEKHTATVTGIGNTGSNNGGSSKFTVELTMERGENMLSGMNVAVSIVLDTTEDVLTLPADALVEDGNRTLVYTGYDAETETLLDPVEVSVGRSDGETVEITGGLAEGQTYYYAYYDTLEVSVTPDFGGAFMFG